MEAYLYDFHSGGRGESFLKVNLLEVREKLPKNCSKSGKVTILVFEENVARHLSMVPLYAKSLKSNTMVFSSRYVPAA